jgi:hypothetical protein
MHTLYLRGSKRGEAQEDERGPTSSRASGGDGSALVGAVLSEQYDE